MFFAPLAVRPSCLSKSTLLAQVREFLNPKNMQRSRVASFSGRAGWFQISLSLSRFQRIRQVVCRLGSCLGNLPLFCALVGMRGRLLNVYRVASLGREVDLLAWCFVLLAAK